METRFEDLFQNAKENGKYDSMEFIIRNKFQPEKELKCKMLDAYFGMFMIDGKSGFCMADTVYKMVGGKESFYFQFELIII